jgi:hypothetical protein
VETERVRAEHPPELASNISLWFNLSLSAAEICSAKGEFMQIRHRAWRTFQIALIFSFVFGLFAVLQAPSAQAQSRVNDKDMAALMRNLHQDAKAFRPEFDRAVQKSTIRKTSQEKDARKQVADFVQQAGDLRHRFKKDRKGQAEFANVINSAEQIDRTVNSLTLGATVNAQWEKIRTELQRIADAYGMPAPFGDHNMGGSR